jgi:hypothetical protein
VEVVVCGSIPRDDVAAARLSIARLGRYVDRPVTAARLALDPIAGAGIKRRHLARAHIVVRGRTLAARAVAASATMAADVVAERLRRQLIRLTDANVAVRNERRVIARDMRDLVGDSRPPSSVRVKPPDQRAVVPRWTYAPGPEPTLSAIADLLDLGEEFHLFSHVRTGEDVVVHWREDRRIGLLYPPDSVLADENGVVIPKPSRYSRPLTLDIARGEMDALEHRFLYFVHAADERGKVLYLRFDGDYGLVQPR